jgi:hypothetical protein
MKCSAYSQLDLFELFVSLFQYVFAEMTIAPYALGIALQ